jgi:hypothetical protein
VHSRFASARPSPRCLNPSHRPAGQWRRCILLSLGPPYAGALSINPSSSPFSPFSPKTHSFGLSEPSQEVSAPFWCSPLRWVSAGSSRSSAEEEMVEVAATIPLSPLLSQASPPLFPSSVASLFRAELVDRGAYACKPEVGAYPGRRRRSILTRRHIAGEPPPTVDLSR